MINSTLGRSTTLSVSYVLSAELDNYHRSYAACAAALRRFVRTDGGRDAFKRAAELAISDADRNYVDPQLCQLSEPGYN